VIPLTTKLGGMWEILQFLGRGSSASPLMAQALMAELDEEPFPAVEPALYLKVLGAMEVSVTDGGGDSAQDITMYFLNDNGSRLIIMDPEREYTVTFRSSGDPMALEITMGTELTSPMATRDHDRTHPRQFWSTSWQRIAARS
jgi:hypothetical protein